MAKVGIVMGSDSDLKVMSKAADMLEELGIEYELTIISVTLFPHVPRTSPLSSGKEMVGAGSGEADMAEKASASPQIYL